MIWRNLESDTLSDHCLRILYRGTQSYVDNTIAALTVNVLSGWL